MVTPRKNTDLARKRRLVKEVRAAQVAAPITFVISPIQELLGTVEAIAGTELRKLAQDTQENESRRMSEGECRKLLSLTDAAVKAWQASQDFNDNELESLTDEQLETQLLSELERIRARKGATT